MSKIRHAPPGVKAPPTAPCAASMRLQHAASRFTFGAPSHGGRHEARTRPPQVARTACCNAWRCVACRRVPSAAARADSRGVRPQRSQRDPAARRPLVCLFVCLFAGARSVVCLFVSARSFRRHSGSCAVLAGAVGTRFEAVQKRRRVDEAEHTAQPDLYGHAILIGDATVAAPRPAMQHAAAQCIRIRACCKGRSVRGRARSWLQRDAYLSLYTCRYSFRYRCGHARCSACCAIGPADESANIFTMLRGSATPLHHHNHRDAMRCDAMR